MNYKGRFNLLQEDCVSVAGSRKIHQESAKWLTDVINKCKAPVVSGLALGTDSIAHRVAIENDTPTIAVLPCGLENITPRSNRGLSKEIVRKGGLLISDYPDDMGAKRSSYIERNEIIAWLGDYLIVPEFEKKSGTRHTVDFAQAQGKFIFVQDADYSGNQFIIESDKYKTIII